MKQLKTSVLVLFIFIAKYGAAQHAANWTPAQLQEPAQLAKQLEKGNNVPVLISVGPGATIPNSIAIGSVKEKENLQKLDSTLHGLKKNTAVVVYCGCCPFEHCPNVRPAITRLKALGFTNYKLLDLPHNIKADWLDKGYPAAKL